VARNNNDVPAEPLVVISLVAGRLRYPEEAIWNRLEPSDVIRDWDGGYCDSWSKAKSLVDEISAATEAHEQVERQRREKQMADELEGRLQPVRAYEAAERAARTRVRGVEVTAPGAEKPWADLPGSGEDE
jgi:hypothetical protein